MLLPPDPEIAMALNVLVPPTFKLPPIPTPPSTVNAPDAVPVLAVPLLICTVLVVTPENVPVAPLGPLGPLGP
jgi:hypothetical protein